ncbi:transcriptional regulator [Amycolatopsis pretoriensis]|uniref:Transcriptional regulator n=1 Tax=Amycolatopsis pretoriensis TaxID=218821 RepID=A0A1H5R1I8_9PSEU|nr:IclR family transcriptional regulator C-terminal domain-containing protein [Amycolatopsis pretoriensis]SEF32199.1 transcriptional regulator [Amycolatopsis pretoriensis]
MILAGRTSPRAAQSCSPTPPADVRERVLQRPMRHYTLAAITAPDQFEHATEAVWDLGNALAAGLVHEDATGIAVPIRNALNDVVAALSIIVPDDKRARSGSPALLAAVREVIWTVSGRRSP